MHPNDLSLGFAEALYADFLRDPASVPEDWRRYFQTLTTDASGDGFRARPPLGPALPARGLFGGTAGPEARVAGTSSGIDGAGSKVAGTGTGIPGAGNES